MPKTLFISDLHLDPNQPQITNTFFYFLDHIAKNADALYILGDFFESYIGNDDNPAFLQSIMHALHHLTKSNVPVFFMPGNHDFLIKESFLNHVGIILMPDPSVISLYNQKILLMHGDSLCTDDKAHQRFRKITRNKIIQKIFLSLPLSYRQKYTDKLRKKSMDSKKTKLMEAMDVNQKIVDGVIKKYNVARLIHGHTHKPLISEKRIVLDAWHEHGNYLQVDRDWRVELIDIPH